MMGPDDPNFDKSDRSPGARTPEHSILCSDEDALHFRSCSTTSITDLSNSSHLNPRRRNSQMYRNYDTWTEHSQLSRSCDTSTEHSHTVDTDTTNDDYQIPDEDVVSCTSCPAEFRGRYRKGNLARHIKVFHQDLFNMYYTCEFPGCGKTYRRTDARLKHERKSHPELHLSRYISRKTRRREEVLGDETAREEKENG